jgi:hypothetical protein
MPSENILRFSIVILVASSILFALHTLVLDSFFPDYVISKIVMSYGLSLVLSIVAFVVLILCSGKFSENLGFVFMWTIFVKFGVYLFVFKLLYVLDSDPRGVDLSMLLVPYLSTLLFEVYFITRYLKD